jgi:hypothetical protein
MVKMRMMILNRKVTALPPQEPHTVLAEAAMEGRVEITIAMMRIPKFSAMILLAFK